MHRTVIFEKSKLKKMNPISAPRDILQTTAQEGKSGKA